MGNIFQQFLDLIPSEKTFVGSVEASFADKTSSVVLLGGSKVRVSGSEWAIGTRVFIKGGTITGEAPNLPYYEVEV